MWLEQDSRNWNNKQKNLISWQKIPQKIHALHELLCAEFIVW
jgi:hypothetical protein